MLPTAPALFDPHHHRIRADQVFYTGFPEPDVVQPATAVSPCIVEATRRGEQHVQTHQEAKDLLATLIVNERLNDDQGAPGDRAS